MGAVRVGERSPWLTAIVAHIAAATVNTRLQTNAQRISTHAAIVPPIRGPPQPANARALASTP